MKKHKVPVNFEFDAIKFKNAAANNDLAAIEKWAPYADNNTRADALEDAAYAGNIECVKILVEYVDPKMHQSLALAAAMDGYQRHSNRACFDFLYPLSNPDDAGKLWFDGYGKSRELPSNCQKLVCRLRKKYRNCYGI